MNQSYLPRSGKDDEEQQLWGCIFHLRQLLIGTGLELLTYDSRELWSAREDEVEMVPRKYLMLSKQIVVEVRILVSSMRQKSGIFRLSEPGGIDVVRHCPERGFHSHQETADGTPIYEICSDVHINPNLTFDIFDMRLRPAED
ncbi:AMSH-like ubiquitin thioesterase 2 [Platanthera guangdongensis]|uniref:AMSH-like ubiquitin thioesterase 2 n=1 Tax=Platanthera guangdongensis TaxID=2320717 RepID=A0ABR2LKK6_9ASPA